IIPENHSFVYLFMAKLQYIHNLDHNLDKEGQDARAITSGDCRPQYTPTENPEETASPADIAPMPGLADQHCVACG
ncbi:MAG TPA: hypothetical protein PLG06_09055, partial [Anaerolineae bacterium]|nr:hypothetical protein [Anaerolineae bacterium]